MQYKHLVCVTGQNNNKYYDMREKPDGTFDATYGRIGATATTINYPMSKWDSTLNSKLRKGYEDMTELAVITEVKTRRSTSPSRTRVSRPSSTICANRPARQCARTIRSAPRRSPRRW